MKNLTVLREEALQFIKDKEIAIAGASRNPQKFGNIALKTLKSKGLSIYPINPNTDNLDGDTCYKSIQDLPSEVKNLLIVQKPKDTEETIRLAIQKGIKKIWMQKGAESEAAVKLAKDAGITVITNKCILMYAYPSGFHKFHMRMTKLFGKY